MTPLQEQIRERIAQDELEQALDRLRDVLKDQDAALYDEAIAHRATLARLKKERRRGLISGDEEDLKRAHVRFAMLEHLLPALDASPAMERESGEQSAARATAPSPGTKPKRVFISYNHNDSAVANKLKEALQAHGIAVTIDQGMRAGQGIQEFILESIRQTDVTLSLVSNNSLLSAWVAIESIHTFYHEKFDDKTFIACYIDDDFFQLRFQLDATDKIDARLAEIDGLLPAFIEKKLDTVALNNEKTRLHKLRSTLGDILIRLKESLTLDVRDEQFDESVARIVRAIQDS